MRRVFAALSIAGLCAGAGAPAAAGAHAAPAAHAAAGLRLTPVGRFDFDAPAATDPALVAEELSGIAWMGGDRFVAVGDEHACLHFLRIRIDPGTGRVLAARFGKPLRLRGSDARAIPDTTQGGDREGIAYDASEGTVWIANERTGADARRSSLAEHSVRDGRRTRTVTTASAPALEVFARQRLNQGFESLTRSRDGWTTWTASEGPLEIDGARPTAAEGGVVRLQRFDKAMRPAAQHAYLLDPCPARIASPSLLAGQEVNGLSELLLLPDGRLLALERAFAGDSTGVAGLRIRVYEVDVTAATDVSLGAPAEGLAAARPGVDYAPAKKRLLWQEDFGLTNSNFEGMALGPRLRNGDRALLLIADNNGGTSEAIYALRLAGVEP
jgi:hypothetical protein